MQILILSIGEKMTHNVHKCTEEGQTVNWDDLKLFLAVSRCGTISGAAKQLNVQHSTVSRRIKTLEKNLGVSLFIRAKNIYELTQEGAKIKAAALKMESEVTTNRRIVK